MVTIFNRFLRRSLPVLLALVLGLLVAPQPAASAFLSANLAGTTGIAAAAADLHATARMTPIRMTPARMTPTRTPATRMTAAEAVHSGHSTPAVPPPVESVAPTARNTDAPEQISARPRTLRAQVTADALGSRAPPALA